MKGEAQRLIRELGLEAMGPLDPGLPSVWYQGTQVMPNGESLHIAVVLAGIDERFQCDRIGTEAAVLSAFLLCRKFAPDLLINAGTCGGFQARGAQVGSLYIGAKELLFHGRRIPLQEFREFGIGRIPACPASEVAEVIGAKTGILSTSNSFETTSEELAFFEAEGVVVKDMEATAVARLAGDLGIPFLAIKAVTDLIDHPTPEHEAFQRNYDMVTLKLTKGLLDLLKWLSKGQNQGCLVKKPV